MTGRTRFGTAQAPKGVNAAAEPLGAKLQERPMQDILFTVLTVGFFALSIAYVHFCDRIR